VCPEPVGSGASSGHRHLSSLGDTPLGPDLGAGSPSHGDSFTSEVLTDFMAKNLHDPDESDAWNAGFVLGWLSAFLENDSAKFYTSLTIEEYLHPTKPLPAATLQEA
jgi:hypothetical protein